MSFQVPVKNFKGRRGAFWSGVLAGAVHIAIVGVFIFKLAQSAEGHWQSRWLFCHLVDWPLSLLLKYVIQPVVPDMSLGGGFLAYPLGEVRDFLVPGIFYLRPTIPARIFFPTRTVFIIYLTPCIPLSYQREGEGNEKEGRCPS